MEPIKHSKQEVIEELWRRGVLSFKLDKNQKDLYRLFHESNHKIQTWLLARRSGKSYTLCCLAIEMCLRKPNSIIKYVSPTKLQVNTYLRPLMAEILKDCPDDLKPEFRKNDFIYYFPNGSEIQLAGSEHGHAEKLRGGSSHIAIIDEAGDVTDLNNVIKSVLLPTTLTTKGKIIIAGTPPKSEDHDFVKFIEEADVRGSLIKRTVYENPRIAPEDLEDIIKETGGINTEQFRREYLCEIVKDETISVVPEFTSDVEKSLVKEWVRPVFYDCYEAMDIGFKDLTVVLFGYFDFRADKVVIEDELVIDFKLQENNIPKLVKDIKDKENALWLNPLTQELKKPSRVSDINYIVIQEIQRASNNEIMFNNTKKDDKEAAINKLRVMLAAGKIIINPKCTTLVRHLKNVKWRSLNDKSTFARSPDNGHYDAVDALIYFIRNVYYTKNPYPAHLQLNTKEIFYYNPQGTNQPVSQPITMEQVFTKIFNPTWKKKKQ